MRSISAKHPIVLGSASPRRRDLLAGLELPFEVLIVHAEEAQRPGEGHELYLERVVHNKLDAVQEQLARAPREHAAVLVADTIVLLDEEILGKPRDVDDAVRLVSSLVGRTHRVHTRYAVALPGGPEPVIARTVESFVTMRAACIEEVRRYARSGEGLDKAGAYAVQGMGAFLVKAIEGSWSNVVGLPVCELISDLEELALLDGFPLQSS